MSPNRPSHFYLGGAAAIPRHVLQPCTDFHGLLSTRRELARAGFIATLRRSPPEASNTSVRRTEALDSVNPKEAPRKCGARVKWSSLWQSNDYSGTAPHCGSSGPCTGVLGGIAQTGGPRWPTRWSFTFVQTWAVARTSELFAVPHRAWRLSGKWSPLMRLKHFVQDALVC